MDKENETHLYASLGGRKSQNVSQTLSETRADWPHKPWPSTPATRLPLADLIGNVDDHDKSRRVFDESPMDQITWEVLQSPYTFRKPTARSTKRARSSSPPSAGRPGARDASDTLKTPQADLARELLWKRYAIETNDDTPAGLQAAALANMAVNSSPSIRDDRASSVAGLRRWTSCGTEWPSSKAKRRKVMPNTIVEDPQEPQPQISESRQEPNEKSTSRIGSLLERMQERLDKPDQGLGRRQITQKAPSSPSPIPVRQQEYDHQSISPSRAPDVAARLNARSTSEATRPVHPPTIHDHAFSDSTSFGSDNMDDELLRIVDARPTHPVDTPTHLQARPATSPTVPSEIKLEIGEDEFDDDDLDIEEMERLAFPRGATSAPQPAIQPIDSDLFDDDDLDDDSFALAETAATQISAGDVLPKTDRAYKPSAIQRYKIMSLSENTYRDPRGNACMEKILSVEEETTKLYKAITLRESWTDTHCSIGAFVHVIGRFDKHGLCIIDDSQNILILHPDHLISALIVADSFGCLRRSVLQDRIKATSEQSPPMIYGTLLHEIFQEALTNNRWDDQWLAQTIEAAALRHIEDLYITKLTVKDVVDHLKTKTPQLQSWAERFVRMTPAHDAFVKDRNNKQVVMSVNKLLDVEEHIWSPMYGLKGNVDATVQVKIAEDGRARTLTVPFELKTGKNSTNASHRAQTALYTLLLSDRYDVAIAYGILYYIETSEISRVPAVRHELRHMIMQRNELACYVRERLSLPPMLRNSHVCGKCFAKSSCFLYHRLVENGDGETSGMRDKFDAVVRHLKPAHQAFFVKWDELLTKEESEMMKFRRELWTMSSTQREKHGRCFGNVVLESTTAATVSTTSKINRYQYTFQKLRELPAFSFTESQLTTGEPIVVSDEEGHYALAKGFVTSVTQRRITVAVDRRLHNARIRMPGFDAEENQVFAGIMNVDSTGNGSADNESKIVFRLDKDEFSNGMATVRNNLVQIMSNDVFHAHEIRSLVVDSVAPRFRSTSSAYALSGPASQSSINDDQRAAIEKIMTAQDYALVLGMPGTGKTTTIAHIIRALVAKGKSVLLASYTHNAVDNILLKIRQDKISVLRLGAIAKVHHEVREFAILGGEPKTSIEELEEAYHAPQVVATTCLGINHQVFNERLFDYCIVDEASQITLPVCLGPIRMAKAFVLVGDHYQLPPLVQNREALEGGLDVSLFSILREQHPQAIAALKHQYRMNAEIMSLSNGLIYSGQLVCGSPDVARRRLRLPSFARLADIHGSALSLGCPSYDSPVCWINRTLNPDTSPPVMFLNTDTMGSLASEALAGSRITNPTEAMLIALLVRSLSCAGLAPSAIGVITLYRSQLALLKSNIISPDLGLSPDVANAIETHTTDRFQGRDKDVILLSCVRSNEQNNVGDLLKDWRRVNVALTRARSKLIIVGSKKTLASGDELLAKMINMCEKNMWLTDLPANAISTESHCWKQRIRRATPAAMGCRPASIELAVSQKDSQKSKSQPARSQVSAAVAKNNSGARPALNARAALGVRSSNVQAAVQKPFRCPAKVGKVTSKAVLGNEALRNTRPVLADLVMDVVGEDFFD